MLMNITINSIEIIHNGGQKVINILIHHNPDSIMNQLYKGSILVCLKSDYDGTS